MYLVQSGSQGEYTEYLSNKLKIAEEKAQQGTLQALAFAIQQQRQILTQTLDKVDRITIMTSYVNYSHGPHLVRVA